MEILLKKKKSNSIAMFSNVNFVRFSKDNMTNVK